jgi:hypothetical protein
MKIKYLRDPKDKDKDPSLTRITLGKELGCSGEEAEALDL